MPFRFSTKYQDEETGLLYYSYRYYQPSTGRWPSRDPIGITGGINLYSFCANNPLVYIDVDGLLLDRLVGAAVGGVMAGGYATGIALIRGQPARDVLIAAGSGFVGGAVAGVLLTPPPVMSPQLAGAIGGAVSGALTTWATEYFRIRDMDGNAPKVRITANIVASATVGAVFGAVGGQLGQQFGDGIGSWYPFRNFQMRFNIAVEIEGCSVITDGSLGIAATAVSMGQDGFNSAYDALQHITTGHVNHLYEQMESEQSPLESHPKR